MLRILEKIESRVTCIIDDKQYSYLNGNDAYQQLSNKYSIISISTRDNQIIIQLEQLDKSTNEEWIKDYKQQFGEEPSFF